MIKTWLVLDCNFLCHRAHYTFKGLSHDGDDTGAIYGFLKTVQILQDEHATSDLVFCFDYGRGRREDDYPGYKSTRRTRKLKPGEQEEMESMRDQIHRIRQSLLPQLGFNNVFWQKGYEADDLIASVIKHSIPIVDRVVMISADKDLYQLLSPRVSLWNPSLRGNLRSMTYDWFKSVWGIEPKDWAKVKAIAGCSTDDVKGVHGVGEVTASRYLRGMLRLHSKQVLDIERCKKDWERNIPIVTLPYAGVNKFNLMSDTTSPDKWREVLQSLGMESLL